MAVEDAGFGAAMEQMFEADLCRSTEVLLTTRRRARVVVDAPGAVPASSAPRRPWTHRRRRGGGSTSRAAAGAFRFGNTMGAALTATRQLGAAEAWTLAAGGALLLAVGALAAWKPASIAYPVAAGAIWLGLSLAGAAWRARRPR